MLLGGLMMVAWAHARCCFRGCSARFPSSSSIVGTFFVSTREGGKDHERPLQGSRRLRRLSAVAFYFVSKQIMGGQPCPSGCATLVGLALTAAMIGITEYYTPPSTAPCSTWPRRRRPVMPPTSSRAWGVSMKACALPSSRSHSAYGASYRLDGLYGIAIAATAMLSMTG